MLYLTSKYNISPQNIISHLKILYLTSKYCISPKIFYLTSIYFISTQNILSHLKHTSFCWPYAICCRLHRLVWWFILHNCPVMFTDLLSRREMLWLRLHPLPCLQTCELTRNTDMILAGLLKVSWLNICKLSTVCHKIYITFLSQLRFRFVPSTSILWSYILHENLLHFWSKYISYYVPYTHIYIKVKVSHNRPKWPKGFRVG
jgi:hypothetical protein